MGELVEYSLRVRLTPDEQHLAVQAEIFLPSAHRQAGAEFQLSRALTIVESQPAVVLVEGDAGQGARYALKEAAPAGWLRLEYSGDFHLGLSDQKEEYTRGFRETDGIVGTEGVYLAGSSLWVPRFDDELIRFQLEVSSQEGWHVISQGNGSSGQGDGHAHWDSGGALEQIYLVGGPLRRWSDSAGAIETLVYLHDEDEALSSKYLDVTARYLEMYRGLLGTYPYEKFALVENFWETGYGMPSFTLLGEEVIRFPFILHSSYPHEILHNWWGNSVFVDYESGNWCEGLTAYMADHLVQEQRGLGALYRRGTLQKYRDYVKEGRDFPLREFRNRHSAATEAVGYGKALMGFHMLRRRLGDEVFVRSLQRFYRDERGERAGFDDLRSCFEAESGEDLAPFFTAWLERTGAPKLRIDDPRVKESEEGPLLYFRLIQEQVGEAYDLRVPVVIESAGGVRELEVRLSDRIGVYELALDEAPTALAVDPDFDLFRLLDPRETPPSIGQIFGEARILALLPSEAQSEEQELYRALVEAWQSDAHAIEIRLDSEFSELPADSGLWILGRSNRFAQALIERRPEIRWQADGEAIQMGDEVAPLENRCLVLIDRHPADLEKAVGLLIVDPPAAREGLARKLPHYGKYSYLAFEGQEPTNVIKGQWQATNSPLVARLDPRATATFATAERPALAELPPAFSQKDLRAHVEWLSDPAREGRGLGSPGLQASAEYIAEAFEAMGLEPAGDEGSWYQSFEAPFGAQGETGKVANVVGLLRGSKADWKDECVILSAHYDHLGLGWPDVHAGDEGQLHPGANDNASGVAVMIEVVRNLVQQGTGSRSLLVIAFTGEEAGLLGSKHYVQHPVMALDKTLGVINLDAVGLLEDGPITIYGAGTSYEWPHVFRGCGFVTGVPNKSVPAGAEGSDQWSFIQAGVPAVQIFAGAGQHYHRPGDVAELLDYAGLVKVATFLKEAVVYMLEREEPFQITIEGTPSPVSTTPAGGKRGVSFGSIPEYGYDQGGMLLSGVSAGSPAEKAGLQKGDVLIRIDDTAIANTRGFANVLKTLKPGQVVVATVLRDGVEVQRRVELVAR